MICVILSPVSTCVTACHSEMVINNSVISIVIFTLSVSAPSLFLRQQKQIKSYICAQKLKKKRLFYKIKVAKYKIKNVQLFHPLNSAARKSD